MNDFHRLITQWYRQNSRDLPWRNTNNPYFIWLSEIILQQTRVNQGLKYYLKFTKNYPTIQDLSVASEEDVLNDWQGLGYYSRGRNLLKAAQQIQAEFEGVFPNNFNDIIKLKGVGQYTASAIASFAFNEKKAVVDGNVYRLLSRYFGVSTPIDSTAGKKEFQALADELISEKNPALHNQAIMEIGALVCTPKNTQCNSCPLNESCYALQQKALSDFPVKSKKIKTKNRYFHFLFYQDNGFTYLEKRTAKGIWQNMYQFPLIEASKENEKFIIPEQVTKEYACKHLLSHQTIFARFHYIQSTPKNIQQSWIKIKLNELENYPLPKLMEKGIQFISQED